MTPLGKKAGWILLFSTALAGAFTFADAGSSLLEREAERDKVYTHLMQKVAKVADKNSDGRMDLNEARAVVYEANNNLIPLSEIEKRIMYNGFIPSISQMQNYLKIEGKFDPKTDDSPILRQREREFVGYLRQFKGN